MIRRKGLERVIRVLALRSSNAATPIKNKKKYSRTVKHKGKNEHE